MLETVTSELILSDIEKQQLALACIKEIDIDYTYPDNIKRVKNTAKKWNKAEAEAHGYNYSNDKSFDKKDDLDVVGSDSDAN